MKLINPVERDVSTFKTQANLPCSCTCVGSVLVQDASNGAGMF
ncbi:hypothetical protein [Ruminiclostridium josui]|nr:hypothetical protein [Ruminiclostridium josui]